MISKNEISKIKVEVRQMMETCFYKESCYWRSVSSSHLKNSCLVRIADFKKVNRFGINFCRYHEEEFSKRRLKILASVSQKSTWSEREKAWASTRTPKVNIEIEELKQKWIEEATALKIIFPKPRLRLDIKVPSNSQQDLNQDFKDCESEENLIYAQYNAEFLRSIAQNMEKIISTVLEDIGVLDDNNQVFETNPFTFYKQEDTILIQRYDGTEILKDGKFTPETSQEDFENLQEFTLIAIEHIEQSQSENLNRSVRR